MNRRQALRRLGTPLGVLVVAASGIGQAAQDGQPLLPQVGQQGKDIVWLPTPHALVERMLDLARISPEDHVIDLGSGDGRVVIAAAQRGAVAVGIEYNPALVEMSTARAEAAGLAETARFVQADLFASDLSQATVVTMFLSTAINSRLRERLLALRPGTRIVSNTFGLGQWEPDETIEVGYLCDSWCRAFLWVVPAQVHGTWALPTGHLTLEQEFQIVTGTITLDASSSGIVRGRLLGDQLTFTAGVVRFSGRVTGHVIQGTYQSEGERGSWTATRVTG